MGADLTGTIVDTVLVLAIVVGACVIDVFHNPCNHPRKYVVRRFLNWFLVFVKIAIFPLYFFKILNIYPFRAEESRTRAPTLGGTT